MPPKKNAFIMFVRECQNKETKKGNVTANLQELIVKLTPVWNSLSEDEKIKYKRFADNYNRNRTVGNQHEQISILHQNNNDYWKMKTKLSETFQNINNVDELLKKNFFLLHVNCHSHEGDKYYFPAEIAVLEFNLLNGISRTYHQLIGISDIYPRGFVGGMREHSDLFHQISCWHKHPDDYRRIVYDLLSFLKDEECHSDLIKSTLDLPVMFTIEEETGNNMMKMKNSLHRLCQTAFPEHDTMESKPIFSVGSIERLLFEMKTKLDINWDHRNIQSGMACHDILENDMYGAGLGCEYHEEREIAYKCSKARIFQWMSNMCKHINELGSIQIIPGRHIAVQLRDGSRMIVENVNIPLTVNNLRLNIS